MWIVVGLVLGIGIAQLGTVFTPVFGVMDLFWRAAQVAPFVLGFQRDIVVLVLIQDSGELRPTGGFIGNYGIVRLQSGRVEERRIGDTYLLDYEYFKTGQASRPVAMFHRYFPESTFWALRDSNIWPDFPTSARRAARFAIEEGATDQVDAVVAITPELARRVMRAIGPLKVDGFSQVITYENFEDWIRYYQMTIEGQHEMSRRFGGEEATSRKAFTMLLGQAVIDRVTAIDPNRLLAVMGALREAILAKDVQVYFEDQETQSVVSGFGLDGAMKSASGDYFWVVDMNVGATKDNLYVEQDVEYTADFSSDIPIAHLKITYNYLKTGERFLGLIQRPHYGDYLRVYAPIDSEFIDSTGLDAPVLTSIEGDKTVLESYMALLPGTVRTVTMTYRLSPLVVEQMNQGQYSLIAQRQAGSRMSLVRVNVIPPPTLSMVNGGSFVNFGRYISYRGTEYADLDLKANFH